MLQERNFGYLFQLGNQLLLHSAPDMLLCKPWRELECERVCAFAAAAQANLGVRMRKPNLLILAKDHGGMTLSRLVSSFGPLPPEDNNPPRAS